MAEPFARLQQAAAGDELWSRAPYALGAEDGTAEINRVPGTMSSMLPASEFGKGWSDKLQQQTTETIQVRRLDSVIDEVAAGLDAVRAYLKMDTQGFDLQVFEGAGAVLDRVVAMQSEVSCVPIYDGMPRLPEQWTDLRGGRLRGGRRLPGDPRRPDPAGDRVRPGDGARRGGAPARRPDRNFTYPLPLVKMVYKRYCLVKPVREVRDMSSDQIANSTVPQGSSDAWTDKKRYLWLIGLVVPSLAFAGYGLWLATGIGAWFWIGPVVILAIVPAIDLFAGLDQSNPPDDAIEALEKDKYYRWITYLFLPIQYAGFVGAMYLIARGDPLGIGGDLATIDKIGLAISIGCIGGIGINTAHELGHKREENERWLSKIALAQSFYGHFYIEHNRGHHVRVATPEDPASSRMGENFYQFWPRTVLGSLKSAWSIEKRATPVATSTRSGSATTCSTPG